MDNHNKTHSLDPIDATPPKVALVLSSGGVKGMAHIGCLEALKEANIPIDVMIGCSIGSLVGSLYASGMDIPHIYNLAIDVFPETYSYRLLGLPSIRNAISGNGIFSTTGIEEILKSVIKNRKFEELNTPLRVVATNLNTGSLDEFSEGDLIKPVCASSAIPGFFSPVSIGKNIYSDGAILSGLPVRVAKKMKSKIIIGCNLATDSLKESKNVSNPFLRSLDILRKNAQQSEKNEADILIDIVLDNSIFFNQKSKAYEMYKLGKLATEKMIPTIQKFMQSTL